MRLAISNIALPAYDHAGLFPRLRELGLTGLEVAPSRAWENMDQGPSAHDVDIYRRAVERAGLTVVGLHSLFWQVPDLGLFRAPQARAQTLDFLVRLSALCRDLGGRTLIYGSAPARRRGALSREAAIAEAVRFFNDLCPRIESHGTCFCFEPLGPEDSDFVNSAFESLTIVRAVGHPALRVQLDAKALVANSEVSPDVFRTTAPYLVHFHANEPDLGIVGSSGKVDHGLLGRMLNDVGYKGFVSIEQRMLSQENSMSDIETSAAALRRCYGGYVA